MDGKRATRKFIKGGNIRSTSFQRSSWKWFFPTTRWIPPWAQFLRQRPRGRLVTERSSFPRWKKRSVFAIRNAGLSLCNHWVSRGAESHCDRHYGETRVGHGAAAPQRKAA